MNKFFLSGIKLRYIIFPLIIFNVFLASRWVSDGNIFFHTDIARDFLLMEDIVENKHPTLIGPRSGAIPGLFHGPLWLYLNLPSFMIGNGDPVIVGWFWVMIYILSILITYYVGKKLFGAEEGLLSALLLSSVTVLNVRTLFNPYGALILAPLYFYLFTLYLKNKSIKTLFTALFVLGLIIQFQMAFGVPILILSTVYLIYWIIKMKTVSHLSAFLILTVPLSTFILFDLRNNFLQVRSVINYLWGSETHGKLVLGYDRVITLRLKESVIDGLGLLTGGNAYLTIFLLLFFIFALYRIFKYADQKQKQTYLLFVILYGGFWFLAIFFKGPVWGYYSLPFIPLLVLIFVSFRQINKIIFYALFILIYAVNLQVGLKDIFSYNPDPTKQDVSVWKFNKLVAEKVFSGNESEFGYFIFTPDLYGYSPRYALDFYQKRFKNKKVKPYEKKAITYLVIAPPPYYGKDPNSIWYQKNINSTSWKSNDVRLNKKPQDIILFENGFVIEKYQLTDEEIKVEPNPYLIKDIFFR